MTPEQIAEGRRLSAAAIPAPWAPLTVGSLVVILPWLVGHRFHDDDSIGSVAHTNSHHDAALIVHMRNTYDDLLAEHDRFRGHSVTLNSVAWVIAEALGIVDPEAETAEIRHDPLYLAELLRRLYLVVVAELVAATEKHDRLQTAIHEALKDMGTSSLAAHILRAALRDES